MSALDVARDYLSRGWTPIPMPLETKEPKMAGWPKAVATEEKVARWFRSDKNIGIVLGASSNNLVDADLDVPEAVKAARYLMPKTESVFGRKGSPNSHQLYVAEVAATVQFESNTQGMIIEVRSNGGQTVFPGSVHVSGERIEWSNDGEPATVDGERLVAAAARTAAAAVLARKWPQGGRHNAALALAGALRAHGWKQEAAERFVLAVAHAAGDEQLQDRMRAVSDTYGKEDDARLTGWGKLGKILGNEEVNDARGWLESIRPAKTTGTPVAKTEDDAALALVTAHPELRYVAMWGKWMQWGGQRWSEDGTLCVFDDARKLCRAAYDADHRLKDMKKAKTVAAVERLARSDRRVAATVEQWDADDWLLNTPHGIVDLRSGALGAHDAEQYITKMTAVAPGGTSDVWDSFLVRVCDFDHDLVAFLQRLIGYCLTGSTREHVFAFFYGTGANGKGTFLNTLRSVLSDYAKAAPIETFTESRGERHPTDLAMLRGARMVIAQETESGRRWAESRLKALTGGDPVAARFMRQDFFEYVPQFKLLLAGNHKPRLSNVDEAMRRRMLLVPFTVTIPPAERDMELGDKLLAEAGGILEWAVEGCRAYQRDGLNPPASVLEATDEYFEGEDSVGLWLAERCEVGAAQWASSSELFSSWRNWAEDAGAYVGSSKALGDTLASRGFAHKKRKGQRGFSGLRPKSLF